MSYILSERQCPKCNEGIMEYCDITFMRHNQIVQRILFACNKCDYEDKLFNSQNDLMGGD